MHRSEHENDYSLILAEGAFAHIHEHRSSAHPHIYELWYSYVSGQNPKLSEAIDIARSEHVQIDPQALERIYEDVLGPQRELPQITSFGTRLQSELDDMSGIVDKLADNSMSFAQRLKLTAGDLGPDSATAAQVEVVRNLIALSNEICSANRALEARLEACRGEIADVQDSLQALVAQSMIDPLTGLCNRKAFDTMLGKALVRADTDGSALSLMICDIDHFKSFNDRWGHLTGDQILRAAAQIMRHCVRGDDVPARYGGEEFAVILPETGLEGAHRVAERIRQSLASRELTKRSTSEKLGQITVSIGLATCRRGESADALFERADQCLYRAKSSGRNRTVTDRPLQSAPLKATVA